LKIEYSYRLANPDFDFKVKEVLALLRGMQRQRKAP
jgi:hypothetical protein